jgi:hypothetical protein
MPLAELFIKAGTTAEIDVDAIDIVCQEIIPAALRTKNLQLTTGDIEFIAHTQAEARLGSDLLLVIAAYPSKRRWRERAKRSKMIKAAVQRIVGPDVTVNVALRLDLAYWVEANVSGQADNPVVNEAVATAQHRIVMELERAPDPDDASTPAQSAAM